MAPGDELPADCELLRYVSGSLVQGDEVDGAAFRPREVDEGKLSLHRRGAFSPDPIRDLRELREVKSRWMTIRPSGRLAQISRENLDRCAREADRAFGYVHDPLFAEGKPDDPSHCLVSGIPETDDDVATAVRDMIAMSVTKTHLAIEKK